MATIIPVSTTVRMALNAGTSGTKPVTKNVSLGNINEAVGADDLLEMTDALAGLLEFPVTAVKKYSVTLITKK